jgi:hypothetical protein
MRFTVKRLMLLVAFEAVVMRAALATADSRGIPRLFGEIFGIWLTFNLMCVVPGFIVYLRSRSVHPENPRVGHF